MLFKIVYAVKHEEKFTKFNYEYPEVEGTIYDLKINNFKVQDKKEINENQFHMKKVIWLENYDYFFIFPEKILIEKDIIKVLKNNIDKKLKKSYHYKVILFNILIIKNVF